ncbi:MAG: trypsin-like peptidase domain-containing protein [Pirellulales bacterium]|nr:trypsin-like peptidase domain-containing protein [Pirellulales bacterium]
MTRAGIVALLTAGLMVGLCESASADPSDNRMTPLVKAIQKARPSVVNIRGEKSIPADEEAGESFRRVNGMGTGVVIDSHGYIITNFHVVEAVEDLRVTLADRRTFEAHVVAADRQEDLALIKIDGAGELPVIQLGTSSDLMYGETVIAVGNPFGYQHTVTKGIVSALHRTVNVNETLVYEDLIQTDASINPGNSGGPLINIDGEMIGIAVAVRAGAVGIGFAIPVDRAMAVGGRLLAQRSDSVAWHGLDPDPAVDTPNSGYVVGLVESNSPAAQAGLRPGDVITAVDSMPLSRSIDFERALMNRSVGDTLMVTLRRGGETQTIDLALAQRPWREIDPAEGAWELLGLRLRPVSNDYMLRRRARYNGGLLVTDVRAGSPAAREGVVRGDILLGIHDWETISLENLAYVFNRPDFADFDPLKFYVLRGNQTSYGFLRLSASAQPVHTNPARTARLQR